MANAVQEAKLAAAMAALQEYQVQGSHLFEVVDEEQSQAYARAIKLLNQRGRSTFEMEQRLRALDFSAGTIAQVIQRLTQDHYLDDADFASEWVRQRHSMRGKSRAVLDRELRDKGIAAELREAALSTIEPQDERDTALALARKRAKRIKEVPATYQDYQKQLRSVVGVLARRGFPQSLSMELANQALKEHHAALEAAETASDYDGAAER
ncbi:MAG: regulatory protein RecX [Corynebacterium sp.]|nr:regulatory protein RecX [Corynebacterium sp.]